MSLGVDLGDRDAWDDSALIQSWEEALAEYKVERWPRFETPELILRDRNITASTRKGRGLRMYSMRRSSGS